MKKVLLSLIAITMLFNLFIVCVNADTKTNDGVYELTEEGHAFFHSIFEYDRIMPILTNEKSYPPMAIPKLYKWEDIIWDEKTLISIFEVQLHLMIEDNRDLTLEELLDERFKSVGYELLMIDKGTTKCDSESVKVARITIFPDETYLNDDVRGKTFVLDPWQNPSISLKQKMFVDLFEAQDGKIIIAGEERSIVNVIPISNAYDVFFDHDYLFFFTDKDEVFIRRYHGDTGEIEDFSSWDDLKETALKESERMSEYARKFFELHGEPPIIGGSVSDEELDRMIAELDAKLEFKKNNPEASVTSFPENKSVISPDTTVDLPESDKPINLAWILIPSAVGILLILGAVVGIKKKKP